MTSSNKLSFSSLFKFVLNYVDHKKTWVFFILITLIYVTLGRSLPILFGRSIDLGILSKDQTVFRQYCYIFLMAGLGRVIVGFGLHYYIGKESNRIAYNVRKHIFDHVLSLSINYFDLNPSGKILTKVANDTKSFQTLLGNGVIGIFICSLELISIFIALFIESPLLSLVILISFPISLFIGIRLAKKIQKEFFDMKSILSSLNAYLADSLNGFYVIKTYDYFPNKYKNFKRLSTDYYDRQIKASKIYALLWPQLDLFQLLSSVACFALGTILIQRGMMNVGSLIAFTLLVQGFFHPLRFILESLNQVQNGLTSGKRIQDVIESPSEPDAKSTEKLSFTEAPSIKIENLSFSYDQISESKNFIFKNFNLTFKPSTITALTGRTGSGKTTLVSLLQKLYIPNEGNISIGNRNLDSISNADLRENLCVVRQEDFIFEGSIAENISLKPTDKIDFLKVKEALKFSGITKDLNFKVNSSGDNLSPGEKQLLSFARIHYLSPQILIFDEATSFIDEETEALIQKKSGDLFKNKTVIIIAHKKTTIEMCDEHISL